MSEIPIVDCGNDILSHSGAIFAALEKIGFVYLKNVGISEETHHDGAWLENGLDRNAVTERHCSVLLAKNNITPLKVTTAKDVGNEFWKLPQDVKDKYARKPQSEWETCGDSGYVGPGVETLNPGNAAEYRESFNVTPWHGKMICPDDDVAGFSDAILSFYRSCQSVAMLVLDAVAKEQNLQDKAAFRKAHAGIGIGGNPSTVRLLHYPPCPDHIVGAERCGEHSDYGSITLLCFEDEGLEVLTRQGDFIPANPVPNTILVNTADMLQRWTSDRLIAVRHRVLVGADKSKERRSVVFFACPDLDCVVKPLDNSDKYPPIETKKYLQQKYSQTY